MFVTTLNPLWTGYMNMHVPVPTVWVPKSLGMSNIS